ncbi:MAG TPA: hypothetical protein P5274_02185, partial [Candidatus Paceibacterota bacterium]|nr:hypothetical protein [Candidatus Paceibacterota bacterium]
LEYYVDWGDRAVPLSKDNTSFRVNQSTTFTHSYSVPGTYIVKFKALSAPSWCGCPSGVACITRACAPTDIVSVETSMTVVVKDASTVSPSVTVVSPNGSETLIPGQTYKITWSPEHLPLGFGEKINIYLVDDSISPSVCTNNGVCCSSCSNRGSIASALTTSFGEYLWTIPIGQKPGTTYKIYARTVSNDCLSGCVSDKSDNYFTIADIRTW